MKPSKQQQQAQPKKTLSGEMGDRLKNLAEIRLEKAQAEKRSKFKEQEDEQMRLCYGPNWRMNYPGEPEKPMQRAPSVAPGDDGDDRFDDEYYDDHPQRRKAS